MLKELKNLVNLQKVDSEMDELMKHKNDFPKKVELLKLKLQDEMKFLDEKRKIMTDLETKRRSLELELKEKEENHKKKQEKLMSVKSNEAYQAMLKEIDMSKNENEIFEEQILEVLLRIDTAKEAFKEVELRWVDKKVTIENEIQRIEQGYTQLDGLLEGKKKEHNEILPYVTQDVLSLYLKLRSTLEIAITETKKGKCTGCDMAIPPQLFNEIYKCESVRVCPNCRRILYHSKE